MKSLLEDKEKAIILGYDVEALKRNIERSMANIEEFKRHIEIQQEEIETLQSYIKMIEEADAKNGNRLRSYK